MVDHRGAAAGFQLDASPLAGGAVAGRGEENRGFSRSFGFEGSFDDEFANLQFRPWFRVDGDT